MTLTETEAKLVSILAVGVGSFIVGIAPACFINRGRHVQERLFLSVLLCFGGGVLLATSMLHMLPEVQDALPDYAELVFCAGFLFLYMVDEVVHYFWGEMTVSAHSHSADAVHDAHAEDCAHGLGHSHHHSSTDSIHHVRGTHRQQDGIHPANSAHHTYNTATAPMLDMYPNLSCPPNGNALVTPATDNSTCYGTVQTVLPSTSDPVSCCGGTSTVLCHGTHTVPCANFNTGILGLLVALILHAILEGLAVGLQKEASKVFLLVGAIASHKLVVGFCLGVELAAPANSICRHIVAISAFSGGSSLGIGIGMLLFESNQHWTQTVMPILQGLAGGTLLYVTVSEVLPRERAKWHKSGHRSAGVAQFLAVCCGFAVMYLLNRYMDTIFGVH